MLSNLLSRIQQEIEFIRLKIEEYGGHWDDKPVCQTVVTVQYTYSI